MHVTSNFSNPVTKLNVSQLSEHNEWKRMVMHYGGIIVFVCVCVRVCVYFIVHVVCTR